MQLQRRVSNVGLYLISQGLTGLIGAQGAEGKQGPLVRQNLLFSLL